MNVKVIKISNGFMVFWAQENWFCKSLDEVSIRLAVAFKEMSAVEAGFELNRIAKGE